MCPNTTPACATMHHFDRSTLSISSLGCKQRWDTVYGVARRQAEAEGHDGAA